MKKMKLKKNLETTKRAIQNLQKVLKEPILSLLLEKSSLTKTQLETLLIDLVVEDVVGQYIPYENKAKMRRSGFQTNQGVSRGAFNRTLQQARRNIMRSIYTILLLAYLGLLDYNIFRPFEEAASRIKEYHHIREVLAGKVELSTEDIESYRGIEKVILSALEEFGNLINLKMSTTRKKNSR